MSMLNHFFDYKPEVLALDEKALELCQPYFKQMEDIRDYNQLKMLKAFADTQMSSTDMLGTTGYGLWDTGRAKLEQIFAEVMGAEDALVRSQFQMCIRDRALRDQFAPPTIHYEQPDPECDLDYVPNVGREMKMEYALSNSLGFGGHNACLAFKKWEG